MKYLTPLLAVAPIFAAIPCRVVEGHPYIQNLDTVTVNDRNFAIRTVAAKDRIVCEPDTTRAK